MLLRRNTFSNYGSCNQKIFAYFKVINLFCRLYERPCFWCRC